MRFLVSNLMPILLRIFLRRDLAPILLSLLSLGLAGSALVAQYGFGLAPCHLCLLQRWPHYLAAAMLPVLFLLPAPRVRHLFLWLLLGLLVWAASLAWYHVGVEQKWWTGPSSCTSTQSAPLSLDALRAQILAAPIIRCDEVKWRLFGLSMAGWNGMISSCAALFGLFHLLRKTPS